LHRLVVNSRLKLRTPLWRWRIPSRLPVSLAEMRLALVLALLGLVLVLLDPVFVGLMGLVMLVGLAMLRGVR